MTNDNGRRLKVAIHNESAMPAAYSISPQACAEVLNRHGKLAEALDVSFLQDADVPDPVLQETEVLIASLMGGNLPLARLASAEKLRWVHFIGSGVDHLLPLDWLPKGAVLTKSSGAHLPNAGEYGAMALLALNNYVPLYTTQQRRHQWKRSFTTSIRGKTLLLIGVGAIGGAIAGAAKALGLHVVGVRRSCETHPSVDRMLSPDQLDEALPGAHFVFLSAALTPATRGLFDRRRIRLMQPGAGFASLSRGALLDFDALIEALQEGHLGGAVLNAFAQEPLPAASPLWDAPNLIITPHIGTQDHERYPYRVLSIFAENMERYLAAEPLSFRVDPQRGY